MTADRDVQVVLRELSDVRQARRLVADTVLGWGFPELVDDAVQTAHELCVNGLTHGRSDCRLDLRRQDGGILVEVRDENERLPVVALGPIEALSGRGLPLIAALADDWGVETTGTGKVVWAKLRLSPSAP